MRVTYGPGFGIKPLPPMRERVERLEASLLAMPQADCPVRHHFAPGVYIREMSIAAGVTVTGAVHKTENLITVIKGRLRIVADGGTREVVAGDIVRCMPGMKNAVVALEDSRLTNTLPNPDNCTDIATLVERYTESKACELLGGPDNKQLAASGAAEKLKDET